MPIKVTETSIIFTSGTSTFTLSEETSGMLFTGDISAGSFINAFQGTTSGYTSGGNPPIGSGGNTIDKFPFATNANATDVGDLTVLGFYLTGQSSTESGYTSGGSPARLNVIDKFPFAANGNATDVGDLTTNRSYVSGQSSSVSGYTSGGTAGAGALNVIDKFPFASNANATDVGDLTVARYATAGQSSSVSGYASGEATSGPLGTSASNTIDKFPFSTNANATDVGDLSNDRGFGAGQSSTESGYTSGGFFPPSPSSNYGNTIDKFPFATDSNATDVGDISDRRANSAGQSSFSSGYTSGGFGPFYNNVIDRFPFATNSSATDVGDLSQNRYANAGQQI